VADVKGDLAYAEHTAVTRPGRWAALVRDLPRAVEELVPLVRSVLVHHTRVPGFTAGSDRCDDGTELRPVQAVLDAVAALDPAPWTLPRPSRRQLVVDCRSSAVLLCSVLREHGVPARVRFGFASYLDLERWQSHVVCEHHDTHGRWTRTDPDVGRFALGPGEFLDATQAWRSAPAHQDLPRYGYAPDLRGRWAVRWELLRDLAALTGFEALTSDVWGLNATADPGSPDAGHSALLDAVATATTRGRRMQLAGLPVLAVPRVITAAPYLTGRRHQVDLITEGSLDPA